MLGDFSYCNPTKLYFGEHALEHLPEELKKYGDNVLLVYGGGSIKKNGIYDDVMKVLKETGKNITEISGVMPNPTAAKLKEGVQIARDAKADFILAVGGGSVIDYSKALSVSVNYEGDPWEKYYLKFEEPDCETLPVGAVLTMVGTGSEMNAGAVITNPDQKLKIGHVFADEKIMPRFSIMNPRYTMTLPHYQMVSGIYDIFNHICEQYFSGEDDNTSDYIAEGLMRSVIHSSRIANKNPQNYEARSNLMWTATWALNTLIAKGKSTDWMVSYARPGRRCSDKCNTRHDAGSRIHALLQIYHALRPEQIRAVCRKRMGCKSRRKGRKRNCGRKAFPVWNNG
jgi:alcohol dehydrogenase YqhD (iron-dependent ADH family)